MDKVKIQGLTLYSLIGVYDFERLQKQRVTADLVMYTDLSKAGLSDDVGDTLDYGKVAQRMVDIADASSFKLLEALANAMVISIFDEFPVEKLRLSLYKPDILDNADNVGISITRERPHSCM
ncbi:dihydroneopterin aldolase [Glaciecola sp. XM2]|jgi:dihydroneopterin aldolase|uniref:dihydroneopterin aldolase n=1 Tax=Glaciecola sp. XM2 TaxID=1914931 RepID=UPI001BDEB0A7|nr:dihydroneopterin aldolase [Glaciecola sp. XM2]MBT1450377.1 dihydroneopterin aldolase [Glaciecola sp. XM2]